MKIGTDIRNRVEIRAVFGETPEGEERPESALFYLYSVGMERFERADLMVRDVPQWLMTDALSQMNEWCDLARSTELKAGETVGDPNAGHWAKRYAMRLALAPENYSNNPLGTLELVPFLVGGCGACAPGDRP